MSNKEQLQTNNSNLENVLSILLNRQDVTVTPSDSLQSIKANDGSILGTVNVEAVPSKYLNLEWLGCTKYAIDTFTSSTRALLNKTSIPHSLGVKPKIIILIAIDFTSTTNSDVEKVGIFNLSDVGQVGQIIYYNSSATNMRSSASLGFGSLSDSSITVGGSSYYYPAGQVYKLITIA